MVCHWLKQKWSEIIILIDNTDHDTVHFNNKDNNIYSTVTHVIDKIDNQFCKIQRSILTATTIITINTTTTNAFVTAREKRATIRYQY